jgi:putative oxidoreductase
MVSEFGEIGLGQGFRYLTGLIEVIGTVLLLVPRTVGWGVPLLLGISAGALVAQGWVIHGDLVHVLALAILLALIGWLRARG